MKFEIQEIPGEFSICKLKNPASVNFGSPFTFLAMTDEECSLVCKSKCVPVADVIEESKGWRGFRIAGVLDFSLVGVLAKISSLLAENGISIFAVSTFNTDYIFMKSDSFTRAIDVLRKYNSQAYANTERSAHTL